MQELMVQELTVQGLTVQGLELTVQGLTLQGLTATEGTAHCSFPAGGPALDTQAARGSARPARRQRGKEGTGAGGKQGRGCLRNLGGSGPGGCLWRVAGGQGVRAPSGR